MSKVIVLNQEARQKLGKGVEMLDNTVGSTMGPGGRCVIFEGEDEIIQTTKDGVTVAKHIEVEDEIENIGIRLARQAATNTADAAGDGTTTATVILGKFIKKGLELIEKYDSPINRTELKRGIDLGVQHVVNILDTYTKDITNTEDLKKVATISGNNDEVIGNLISTAFEKVGQDGLVSVEESKAGETYINVVDGMQITSGMVSPFFMTDAEAQVAVLEKPHILIVDKKIETIKEISKPMELVATQKKALLIIAKDYSTDVLSLLLVNKTRGHLKVVAIKAPDFENRQRSLLQDFAVSTGGTVVSPQQGRSLEKFNESWFGNADKVTVSEIDTVLVGVHGSEEEIKQRVNVIDAQLRNSPSDFETEYLQQRRSRFTGGVAVVYVGGKTPAEMLERKDRVEDALHATRAALEEGVVPGGGVMFFYIYTKHEFGEVKPEVYKNLTSSEKIGVQLVNSAILTPIQRILTNSDYAEDNIGDILKQIENSDDMWKGFNISTEEIEDFYRSGVIDPKKVTRLALENAASVAGSLLITDSVIATKKEGSDKQQIDPSNLIFS